MHKTLLLRSSISFLLTPFEVSFGSCNIEFYLHSAYFWGRSRRRRGAHAQPGSWISLEIAAGNSSSWPSHGEGSRAGNHAAGTEERRREARWDVTIQCARANFLTPCFVYSKRAVGRTEADDHLIRGFPAICLALWKNNGTCFVGSHWHLHRLHRRRWIRRGIVSLWAQIVCK